LESKLQGKTLAELGGEEETEDWVKRFREKRDDPLDSRKSPGLETTKKSDKQQTRSDYTAEHMKGLRVAHNIEEFREGEDRVLTLKDSLVLDDQTDELIDIELTQAKKLAKTLEDKRRRPGYVAYDEEEFIGGQPGKRSVLSHYDEVLGETKDQKGEEGFVLADLSLPNQSAKNRTKQHVSDQLKKGHVISLEQRDQHEMSNYYSPEELLKFKKVTKRASLKRRDIEIGNGELGQTPIVENPPIHSEVETHQPSSGGHNEDDLQTALEQARLLAKRKKERAANSSLFVKLGKYRELFNRKVRHDGSIDRLMGKCSSEGIEAVSGPEQPGNFIILWWRGLEFGYFGYDGIRS
jgi:U4/U6.U5 tri-snRNP-associated protein 1